MAGNSTPSSTACAHCCRIIKSNLRNAMDVNTPGGRMLEGRLGDGLY